MHALVLALTLLGADADARWPGFLGAGSGTVSPESIPSEWAPNKNIAWQVTTEGHGQSSPVVWGNVVVVSSVDGDMKQTNIVTAVELSSGKVLWVDKSDSSDPVKNSLYVSRAAPTPVADADGVVVYFESGDVRAYDWEGKVRWSRSLSGEFGKFKNKFGLSASPVQSATTIIILVDDEGPSYLISLKKSDGTTHWKVDRTSRVSWSSPALVPVQRQQYVVCSSAGSVDGYEVASGEKAFSYDEVGGNTAATPMPFGEGRFLVAASPGRDGGERVELSKQSNFAMQLELDQGKVTSKILWKTEEATPTFGSPMVYEGYAYWVNRVGVVYCFDVATGEKKYAERIKQSIWATPVGLGDRVFFFGKDGTTTVLAKGPEFKVLSENQLWDPEAIKPDPAKAAAEETPERRAAAANFAGRTQYGVAVTPGRLLIRTGEVLYCVAAENKQP